MAISDELTTSLLQGNGRDAVDRGIFGLAPRSPKRSVSGATLLALGV